MRLNLEAMKMALQEMKTTVIRLIPLTAITMETKRLCRIRSYLDFAEILACSTGQPHFKYQSTEDEHKMNGYEVTGVVILTVICTK